MCASSLQPVSLPPCIEVMGGPLLDQDLALFVRRLPPYETATLRAEMTDEMGVSFSSWVSFRADSNGIVDLSRQAPLEGTYSGIDSMGLFWSMQSSSCQGASFTGKTPELVVQIRLFLGEQEVASKECAFQFKASEVKRIPIRENGLVGVLFLPPSDKPLPVVITLKGSSGGIGEGLSQLMASHGLAVLALGYFGMEGLPKNLHNCPLEYFEKAFSWIRSQPMLDGNRVGLYGASRGGELALILGAWFPESIQAIVAVVPSSVVTSGEGDVPLTHAWSYRGQPLAPFAPQPRVNHTQGKSPLQNYLDGTGDDPTHPGVLLRSFLEGMKEKEAFQAATIPVERIQAPLLLISGGDDQMWPSSLYASQIEERLRQYHSPISCTHLTYPKAGHMITVPYIPQLSPVLYHPVYKLWLASGGTLAENRYACHDSWKKIMLFFQDALNVKLFYI